MPGFHIYNATELAFDRFEFFVAQDKKEAVEGSRHSVNYFEHNIRLSKERATSVVNALTAKHGVAAARLLPYGDGPTAPVAANDTDGGRAQNRRVELVKQ